MIKNNGYPDLKLATRYLDDYLFYNFIRKHNEKDDILITLVGNGIGNISLFPKGKSAIIQNTIGMRFNNPKKFKYYSLLSKNNEVIKLDRGMAQPSIRQDELKNLDISFPIDKEQLKIEFLMTNIDNLITLHQRNNKEREGDSMDTYNGNELFYKYYEKWIKIYKEGAIRNSTMNKYKLSLKWLKKIAPKLKTKEVNRITYQEILNAYAANHERQSTMDFHHQLKSSILDAVDDGLIEKNPKRKVFKSI